MLLQLFPALGNHTPDILEFPGSFPHVKRGSADGELLVSLYDMPESLLPLVGVNHTIFADVDGVKKIFYNGVGGLGLVCHLMELKHEI
jgi:hypothetical protein